MTEHITKNISKIIFMFFYEPMSIWQEHRLLVQEGYTKTYRKDRLNGTAFINNSRYPQADQSHAATLQRKTNDLIIFENKVK